MPVGALRTSVSCLPVNAALPARCCQLFVVIGRIACLAQMRPITIHVARSVVCVCMCFGLLGTPVSPAPPEEAIKMPFGGPDLRASIR